MWAYVHDAGTYYLSDKSKLARKLSLPIRLLAYEDLTSGKIVLTATSLDSKDVQSLTIVDAPVFSAYDGKRSVESHLMQEIGPRRVIWSALLKSEGDAWSDLLQQQQTESIAFEPMMMAMSLPEPITDFRIIQDGTNLSVNLPDEFAGAEIILLSCTNLVEGFWSTVSTNVAVSSGEMFLANAEIPDLIYETTISTNWVNCPNHTMPGETCTNQTLVVVTNSTAIGGGVIFYRTSASSDVDTDSDGLDNVTEYDIGTNYQDPDSDGDGLSDGWEIARGFNPLDPSDVLLDADEDGLPDWWEHWFFDGLEQDGDGDFDGDGILNRFELAFETDPTADQGASDPLAALYEYDELGRLISVSGPVELTFTLDEEGNLEAAN
jgi:hypothetical protein